MLAWWVSVKQARWAKKQRSKKLRHAVNQLVKKYCKSKRYKAEDPDLHLPQWKDVYDNWHWD